MGVSRSISLVMKYYEKEIHYIMANHPYIWCGERFDELGD